MSSPNSMGNNVPNVLLIAPKKITSAGMDYVMLSHWPSGVIGLPKMIDYYQGY